MSGSNWTGRFDVNIGWGRVERALTADVRMSKEIEGNHATIEVSASDLEVPNIVYIGEASVEAIEGRISTLMMTGVIEEVALDGDVATISLVGSNQELSEYRLGQVISSSDVPVQEQIYGILRATRWPADKMNLAGWTPGPIESFTVTVPVVGAVLSRPRSFAGVTFTPVNPCNEPLDTTDIGRIFFSASAWATTSVEAETLFDAEIRGLEKIDLGLSSLRSLGAFSFPILNSVARQFKRSQSRAKVGAVGVAFVRADSGRHLLKSVGRREPTEALDVDVIVPEEVREFLKDSSDQMLVRAVREWRAAVDSGEDYERVAHLWRSIECYANHHSNEALFNENERHAIREALLGVNSWNGKQRERLLGLDGLLNDRPLLEKFRLALDGDGIVISPILMKQITGTRRLRNDLEHGSQLTEPEHRLVDNAIALMNYVIVSVLAK